MLGFGFGPWGRRRRRFSPASLFANGEQGAWYDPGDSASLFEDAAGTVPASLNGPVGRIADKSGRGNHAVQAVAAARPLLREDASGKRYLEFDGVDDRLSAAGMSLAHPWDRVSAIRQVAWMNAARIFGNGSGATLTGLLYQNQAVMGLSLFDTAAAAGNTGAAIGAKAVVTERRNGAASQIAVGSAAPTTGHPGSTAANGVTIGADPGGGSAASLAFYGLVLVKPPLGAAALANLRSWLAARSGAGL
jgi:hypothetical protein